MSLIHGAFNLPRSGQAIATSKVCREILVTFLSTCPDRDRLLRLQYDLWRDYLCSLSTCPDRDRLLRRHSFPSGETMPTNFQPAPIGTGYCDVTTEAEGKRVIAVVFSRSGQAIATSKVITNYPQQLTVVFSRSGQAIATDRATTLGTAARIVVVFSRSGQAIATDPPDGQ